MTLPWTVEITAWEPPHRYAFALINGRLRLAGEQRFEPAGDGCRVEARLDIGVPWLRLGRLGGRIGSAVLQRVEVALAEDLDALHDLVVAET
ncbi:SRPBCC family protein [Egibacter rhizosphaerae]|uniref:SRPBCC family protein n=1 Tax=Egibacter rhizosphaerae TaxID=1670831 RepID=UPI001F0DD8DC|nr:SRPBCC family protein [Egibacter rhizosphaerae]